jgi:GrpB-like predicted nucleotidyltransferase (UPF0157 family)
VRQRHDLFKIRDTGYSDKLLAAKPIVDILVGVTDLSAVRQHVAPVLEEHGYDYFWRPTAGSDTPPFYAWFIRRDPHSSVRTHHIHMVEPHFTQHWERLLFRDHLISHPHVAKEYERIKCEAAARYPGDRVAYTREKSAFIDKITAGARADTDRGLTPGSTGLAALAG